MKFSLRNRIAFYYMMATAIVIAVLFIAIYIVVYKTVYHHLDSDLDAESAEVFNNIVILNDRFIFTNENEWREREHIQFEVNPTFIQAIDTAGSIIRKTPNLFEGSLNFDPSLRTATYFNSSLGGSPTRQLQMPIHNQVGNTLGYLLIAIPLEESALVLNNLQLVLLGSFPVIILILFLVTRSIAGESIRPINEVIATAEKITQENLEERIELPAHKDELYRLASTINGLLERLEEALEREKQFTSDASHELRTPLATIKGTLEVLIRRPRDTEHYENKIRFCINELKRMSDLIDRLLLLARYDSGKLKPQIQTINLSEILETVLARMVELAQAKNLEFQFDAKKKPLVEADPSMLEVILENILSNAIKYSHDGSVVRMKIEENLEETIFSITNQSAGISQEKSAKAFERFYRGDEARTSSVGGFGLGLAIVKKMADLQNFRIRLDSEEDKETRFTLIMPNTAS